MARELIKQGHEVGVYTRIKGVISNLLKDNLDDNPKDYDVALINHNSCAHVTAKRKIYTSHGWADGLETPPPGMDVYVAVSENVAKRHGIDLIIKNPIDTELFKPTEPIRDTPDRVLSITSHAISIPATYPTREAETMPELMRQSDVVITAGRGVLEAMSSGRAVVIYDIRPGLGLCADGYLHDFTFLNGNVGGAYHLTQCDPVAELKHYQQEHGERNREYVIKHHDVRDIVNQYLNLI